jgi:glycosyltransferase involved in cell wall biosynthesis
MKKIIYFANSDCFLYNFNSAFALDLKSKGFEVIFLSPNGKFSSKFQEIGIDWYEVPMNRSSLNVFHNFFLIFWLIKFFAKHKPSIVHNFTLKAIFLGSISAQLLNVSKVVNEVTGLGHIFTTSNFKNKILKFTTLFLLRVSSFRKSTCLVILNKDDFEFFRHIRFYSKRNIKLIHGVGVDCDFFSINVKKISTSYKVLLPCRMLKEKGVVEFLDAARLINSINPSVEFILAGDVDKGNPSSIDSRILIDASNSGFVRWLGHVDDIRSLYAFSDIVVLPSYREGLPTSLTESASCGLPLIATNVPGCVDVVENLVNGLIIPTKDHFELAKSILFLIENPSLIEKFGTNSRRKALEFFDKKIIFLQRLNLYS